MKLTLLLPSVARSSTSSTRWPASSLPSICAPRPKPLGFLRTYCIGRFSRSATQAAKGMPAVSPPATASILILLAGVSASWAQEGNSGQPAGAYPPYQQAEDSSSKTREPNQEITVPD